MQKNVLSRPTGAYPLGCHPGWLTTQPAILTHPPNVGIAAPTARHWEILRTLLPAGQAKRRLVTDAHLAALAIEHGAVLYTNDRDFTRFPGLKWTNPLNAG